MYPNIAKSSKKYFSTILLFYFSTFPLFYLFYLFYFFTFLLFFFSTSTFLLFNFSSIIRHPSSIIHHPSSINNNRQTLPVPRALLQRPPLRGWPNNNIYSVRLLCSLSIGMEWRLLANSNKSQDYITKRITLKLQLNKLMR